jgi:hypothetical protein
MNQKKEQDSLDLKKVLLFYILNYCISANVL